MEKEDIELKLLANVPIQIDGAPQLVIPSFRTVAMINLSVYNGYLSTLMIDKNALENKIDERVTNFDMFYANCFHNPEFKDVAFNGLRLFFMDEPRLCESEDDVAIQFLDGRIDRYNFDSFQYILKIAHYIKLENDKPEFKPKNSKAQEMIDMILKNRKSLPAPKEKMNLVSIVSGLSWKSNGMSIISAFDLNIYQIYNGFFTTNNIDNYHHTLSGLYAGTIDGKQLNMSDIHWANKIKQ